MVCEGAWLLAFLSGAETAPGFCVPYPALTTTYKASVTAAARCDINSDLTEPLRLPLGPQLQQPPGCHNNSYLTQPLRLPLGPQLQQSPSCHNNSYLIEPLGLPLGPQLQQSPGKVTTNQRQAGQPPSNCHKSTANRPVSRPATTTNQRPADQPTGKPAGCHNKPANHSPTTVILPCTSS